MTTQEKQEKRQAYLREYARKWRKKNPGKNADIQEQYWQRRLNRQQLLLGNPSVT